MYVMKRRARKAAFIEMCLCECSPLIGSCYCWMVCFLKVMGDAGMTSC